MSATITASTSLFTSIKSKFSAVVNGIKALPSRFTTKGYGNRWAAGIRAAVDRGVNLYDAWFVAALGLALGVGIFTFGMNIYLGYGVIVGTIGMVLDFMFVLPFVFFGCICVHALWSVTKATFGSFFA